MFVIVRNDDKYVTPSGSEQSYTSRLEDAQTFRFKDIAERNRCIENERVMAITDLLKKPLMF